MNSRLPASALLGAISRSASHLTDEYKAIRSRMWCKLGKSALKSRMCPELPSQVRRHEEEGHSHFGSRSKLKNLECSGKRVTAASAAAAQRLRTKRRSTPKTCAGVCGCAYGREHDCKTGGGRRRAMDGERGVRTGVGWVGERGKDMMEGRGRKGEEGERGSESERERGG
eukprot:799769-Pleurochrysis_carterae.AAC.1